MSTESKEKGGRGRGFGRGEKTRYGRPILIENRHLPCTYHPRRVAQCKRTEKYISRSRIGWQNPELSRVVRRRWGLTASGSCPLPLSIMSMSSFKPSKLQLSSSDDCDGLVTTAVTPWEKTLITPPSPSGSATCKLPATSQDPFLLHHPRTVSSFSRQSSCVLLR